MNRIPSRLGWGLAAALRSVYAITWHTFKFLGPIIARGIALSVRFVFHILYYFFGKHSGKW